MRDPATLTSGRTLDHAAPVYDLLAPMMTLGVERRCHREVIDLLALTGGEQVLDVGCGTGTLTCAIAKQLNSGCGAVIGVDAATRMLEVARRKAAGMDCIRFEAEIAESLPYRDESFDRFASTFFFHHVNFQLKQRTLSELWRTLRPGGWGVIVDVDVPRNLFGRLCAWSGYVLFQQDEIIENIKGVLREAMIVSPFAWHEAGKRSGYITTFVLEKQKSATPRNVAAEGDG